MEPECGFNVCFLEYQREKNKASEVLAFTQGTAFYCGTLIGVNESCSSGTKKAPALLLWLLAHPHPSLADQRKLEGLMVNQAHFLLQKNHWLFFSCA